MSVSMEINGVGELFLVAAVWQRAWMDVCQGKGKTIDIERKRMNRRAQARQFLLNEGALDFLGELGLSWQVIVEMVTGEVDIDARMRRDVLRGYEGGLTLEEIMLLAGGTTTGNTKKYRYVKQILVEEVGDDY